MSRPSQASCQILCRAKSARCADTFELFHAPAAGYVHSSGVAGCQMRCGAKSARCAAFFEYSTAGLLAAESELVCSGAPTSYTLRFAAAAYAMASPLPPQAYCNTFLPDCYSHPLAAGLRPNYVPDHNVAAGAARHRGRGQRRRHARGRGCSAALFTRGAGRGAGACVALARCIVPGSAHQQQLGVGQVRCVPVPLARFVFPPWARAARAEAEAAAAQSAKP